MLFRDEAPTFLSNVEIALPSRTEAARPIRRVTSKMNIPSINVHHGRWGILVLFVGLFLLLASGRMDSGDANAELAGSINLVETGGLGTSTPYSDELIQSLFVQAPDGRYYEAHEV